MSPMHVLTRGSPPPYSTGALRLAVKGLACAVGNGGGAHNGGEEITHPARLAPRSPGDGRWIARPEQ
jgi:hypothetical protein